MSVDHTSISKMDKANSPFGKLKDEMDENRTYQSIIENLDAITNDE
jgi:hypothetical protein